MDRRGLLTGAAAASAALLPIGAKAYDTLPPDVGAALARFRRSIADNFDRAYVEHVVRPILPDEHLRG